MAILLQASNLSKEYSGRKIFSGLTFVVDEKKKIGVIGRNGAGKSTLFRILVGQEEADGGEIMVGSKARMSYLKQEDDFLGDESALDYLLRGSGREEWRAKKIASRFQLDADKLSAPAKSLSGGWRMRLKLARMLLPEPNLFLLDEPTNYLDLSTLILLEEYLRSYNGSFLIISHDREFLKQTCDETLEVSSTGCYHYSGDIEAYLEFKERKLGTMIKANKSIERQQEHLEDFVKRFRYKASKAKQAQSFMRKIKKLESKRIAIEHQAGITRIVIPPVETRHNFALKIKNMDIGYGGKKVVTGINFDVRSGEKLAILGLNGQGKTTLLKTLSDNLEPISGSFRWSSDTKLAYHGPDPIAKLNDKEQIWEYLERIAAPEHKKESILKMAGDLLFRDDDLKKSIGVLSGGEKSRLLLAGLLLSKPDVFLLDEPTCHLDFETVEALGTALRKFNGTILFTSHDRTFCNLIATALVDIRDGRAKRRLENYEEYVERLEKELLAAELEKEAQKEAQKQELKMPIREDYQKKKENQKKSASIEKQLEKLNSKQLELLEYFLANPVEYDLSKAKELEDVKKAIEEKEGQWLDVNS
jgi:ATP-binding cassette, subfamily F, member 3